MILAFGKKLAIGGAGMLGVGSAISAGFGTAFKKTLDHVDELGKLAVKLGVSTEQLSQFAYAAETTGQSVEDLSGHFENLAERVMQGAEGSGEAAETFKKLGIDVAALKLQNPIDQLITLAGAMQRVTNETDRLGMLSSLGGDQFQNLNALFKKGPEGIRSLMQEGRDVGATVASETAANAQKASLAFLRGWTAIKSIVFAVGAALFEYIDTFERVARFIVDAAKGVRTFVQNNKTLIATIAAVGAAVAVGGGLLVGIGVALAAVSTAIGGLVAGFSAISAVVAAVFSPVGLTIAAIVAVVLAAVAAVAGLVYAFVEFTEIGRTLADTFGTAMSEIWGTFKTTFGGIMEALKAGDLSLAWDMAMKGLRIVWNDLIIGLKTAWNDFLKWYFTSTVDGVEGLAKALGLDDVAKGLAANKEEAKNKLVDMIGFDLASDIAHRDQLKRELEAMIDTARAKNAKANEIAAMPLSAYSHGNLADYLAKITDASKGLFNAPSLNRSLGVGSKVKTDKAITDTAKNTAVIARNTANIEAATFK